MNWVQVYEGDGVDHGIARSRSARWFVVAVHNPATQLQVWVSFMNGNDIRTSSNAREILGFEEKDALFVADAAFKRGWTYARIQPWTDPIPPAPKP
jgi:hypothetical protein